MRMCVLMQVLQTSSPSYILLSSLDAARRHAFTPGVWRTPAAAAAAARAQLADTPGLSLLQDGGCGAQESILGFDPLRVVVNVQGLGLTGYDAAAWLEEKHGIVPELSTNKVCRVTCCAAVKLGCPNCCSSAPSPRMKVRNSVNHLCNANTLC
jgi:arginine/lysine/ornithine decarboxylase